MFCRAISCSLRRLLISWDDSRRFASPDTWPPVAPEPFTAILCSFCNRTSFSLPISFTRTLSNVKFLLGPLPFPLSCSSAPKLAGSQNASLELRKVKSQKYLPRLLLQVSLKLPQFLLLLHKLHSKEPCREVAVCFLIEALENDLARGPQYYYINKKL